MCFGSHGSKGRQSQASHPGNQLRSVLLTAVPHCLTEDSRAQKPLLPYAQESFLRWGFGCLPTGSELDGPYRTQLPHP